MSTTAVAESIADDFESERAELLRRAAEKPTLRMINADQPAPITEWQRLYPELALFIEVTKADFSQVYEGKLIATAERSIEFLDLNNEFRQRGLVSLTAYGEPLDPRPMSLPAVFWMGTPLPD
jgi:hypothetical protein